jgi:hypothetical protein
MIITGLVTSDGSSIPMAKLPAHRAVRGIWGSPALGVGVDTGPGSGQAKSVQP